jgi:hypothetical protein
MHEEDGKEFNVNFDGGNFPPILIVKDTKDLVASMDKTK